MNRLTDTDSSDGGGKAAITAALITGGIQMGINAYQNWQNRRNWERENSYNTPSQQMWRYSQAGLSPNLIYGNGTSSAGNAGSIAPYQSQKVDIQDILGAAQAVLSLKTMSSNIRKSEGEGLAALAAARGQELANERTETENHYLDAYLAQRNRIQALDMQLRTGQIGLIEYNKRKLIAEAENLLSNARYTKFKHSVYDPALLAIRQRELSNASLALRENIENWKIERQNNQLRGGILAKDYKWYNWKAGIGLGKDILQGVGSALGAFGIGKFLGGRSGVRGGDAGHLGGSVYMSPSYPEYGL